MLSLDDLAADVHRFLDLLPQAEDSQQPYYLLSILDNLADWIPKIGTSSKLDSVEPLIQRLDRDVQKTSFTPTDRVRLVSIITRLRYTLVNLPGIDESIGTAFSSVF